LNWVCLGDSHAQTKAQKRTHPVGSTTWTGTRGGSPTIDLYILEIIARVSNLTSKTGAPNAKFDKKNKGLNQSGCGS
jgi:hypothetical protein